MTTLSLPELEAFEYVLPKPLTALASYKPYEQRCQQVYASLLAAYPAFEYRPYQYEVAAEYCTRRKNLCGGAPSLGKTTIAGVMLAALYPNLSELRPGSIHITAPTTYVCSLQWLRDLSRFPCLAGQIEVIRSEKQVRTTTKPIWVYQMDFPKRQAKTGTSRAYMSRLLYQLQRLPKCLVVDEIHHLKVGSDRSKHFLYMRRYAKRVLGLSGTLSEGSLEHLHFLLKFVYGSNWEQTKTNFMGFSSKTLINSHYRSGGESLAETPSRYLSHLSVSKVAPYYSLIKSKINRISLDEPRVASVITLPQAESLELALPLTPDHQTLYQDYVRSHTTALARAQQYGQTATGRAHGYSLLQPLIELSNFPEGLIAAKTLELLTHLQAAQQEQIKTVVFTRSVRTSRLLTEYLQSQLGSEAVVRLYASDAQASPKNLSFKAREEVITRFLYEPAVSTGVFSINLVSEGLDLTQASQAIFYDSPWESTKVLQAIARFVRPGAIRNWVKLIYLMHRKTICEHTRKLVKAKLRGTKLLLDFEVDAPLDLGAVDPMDVITLILEQS